MQVSSGRLRGIKVVLGIMVVVGLVLGIASLFFTKALFEGSLPAGEPFSKSTDALGKAVGALGISWAIAAGIALRNVMGNRELLKAVIIGWGLIGVSGLYADAVIMKAGASIVIMDLIVLALPIVLLALYPRGKKAS